MVFCIHLNETEQEQTFASYCRSSMHPKQLKMYVRMYTDIRTIMYTHIIYTFILVLVQFIDQLIYPSI